MPQDYQTELRGITTTEREALTMVYALYKFKNYLLGNQFGCGHNQMS
jgi:hypothetical protein